MRWPDCATPRLPPGTYRSTRSINTRTELAHPALGTGTREPPLFGNLPISLFHFNFFLHPARSRLRVLWTKSPLRSGFEPLTQGFSVLCSNLLSYLNHFHRLRPENGVLEACVKHMFLIRNLLLELGFVIQAERLSSPCYWAFSFSYIWYHFLQFW